VIAGRNRQKRTAHVGCIWTDVGGYGNEWLSDLRAAMAAVADEPWARQIWSRDPRFARYLPKEDATVYDIATPAASRRSGGCCGATWRRSEKL
jgi:hypothetical protein